ncbi:uncharacterized protein PRCAT00000522001 [Priceomyces carsonii]|uniref:uncharacterized protein n=1 Tax=Priceomyces carsonii TaxID=28549 RepID=UPI002EDB76EC|nr:unnamed protein product [Priceomyces carsonii]
MGNSRSQSNRVPDYDLSENDGQIASVILKPPEYGEHINPQFYLQCNIRSYKEQDCTPGNHYLTIVKIRVREELVQ